MRNHPRPAARKAFRSSLAAPEHPGRLARTAGTTGAVRTLKRWQRARGVRAAFVPRVRQSRLRR